MPRLHGLDSDYQRRHRGGGNNRRGSIFSLSTPFQTYTGATSSSSAAPSSSRDDYYGRRRDSDNDNDKDGDDIPNNTDDMEFRGTQELEKDPDADRDDDIRENDDAVTVSAIAKNTTANDNRAARQDDAAASDDDDADDNIVGRGRGREEPFEDGMDDEDNNDDDRTTGGIKNADNANDSSDASTTMDDDSVDLLASSSDNNNDDDKKTSTISPATRTLDRLSQFGSQEGGAELCIRRLLVTRGTEGSRLSGANTAAERNGEDDDDDANVHDDDDSKRKGRKGTGDNDEEEDAIVDATTTGGDAHERRDDISIAIASKENRGRASGRGDDDDDDDTMLGEVAGSQNDKRLAREKTTGTNGGVGGGGRHSIGTSIDAIKSKSTARSAFGKDDDDPKKRRESCLRELKEYFMSTENSSSLAMCMKASSSSEERHRRPPIVPFCHHCASLQSQSSTTTSSSSSSSLPHHGLCPRHPNFYDSGSYEILNLVVDGNILGCDACAYQFDHGRSNKALGHIGGCERGVSARGRKKKKTKDIKHQQQQQHRRQGRKNDKPSVSATPARSPSPVPTGRRRKNAGTSSGPVVSAAGGLTPPPRMPSLTRLNAGTSTRPNIATASTGQLTPPPSTLAGRAKGVSDGNAKRRTSDGPFDIGTIVFVEARTWPGINELGGVARILKVHRREKGDNQDEGGGGTVITYDVKYVVECRREKGVEEDYVTLHSEYVSPSKGVDREEEVTNSVREGARGSSQERVPAEGPSASNDGDAADDGDEASGAPLADEDAAAKHDISSSTNATPADDNVIVDEDGHTLSEYERLRLRNIQRNRARLAQLGLLAKPGSNIDRCDDVKHSKAKKTKSKQQLGQKVERRTQPKRQTTVTKHSSNRQEGDDKPKTATVTKHPSDVLQDVEKSETTHVVAAPTSASDNKDGADPDLKGQATLADAANTGCKKCIQKLRTGENIPYKTHGSTCPYNFSSKEKKLAILRDMEPPLSLGIDQICAKYQVATTSINLWKRQRKSGQLKMMGHGPGKGYTDMVHEDGSTKTETLELKELMEEDTTLSDVSTAATAAATTKVRPEEEEEDDRCDDFARRQNIKTHSYSGGNKASSPTVVSLMDAAKAGCRKCTLEWQNDGEDTTMDHDACCPRVGKKKKRAPPEGAEFEPNNKSRKCHSDNAEWKKRQTSHGNDGGVSSTMTPPAVSLCPRISNAVSTKAAKSSKIVPNRAPRAITPSPILAWQTNEKKNLPQKARPPPPPMPATMPAWIREFISEADRHNETVPAIRGCKWIPCPNPWGKIGHEDGDFVIVSPFQSGSVDDVSLSVFHGDPRTGCMPKRFVSNPFDVGSPYHATHRSPARGGYGVLRLTRDRACSRPWGFTIRLHEFGGACLVDGIEPLSPAEAVEDISGWTGDDSSSRLQLHDMIICINGKGVGSMTMPELQIELDLSGPEIVLVVSRFDIKERGGGAGQLEDLAMDWSDIGAGASIKRKRVSFEGDEGGIGCDDENVYEVTGQPVGLQNKENEECQPSDSDGGSECDITEDRHQQPHPRDKASDPPTKQSRKRLALSHPKQQKKAAESSAQSTSLSATTDKLVCKKGKGDPPRTGTNKARSKDSSCPGRNTPRATDRDNKKGGKRLTSESMKDRHSDSGHKMKTGQTTPRIVDTISDDRLKSSETNHKGKREPKTASRYQKQLEMSSKDEFEPSPQTDPKKTRDTKNRYSSKDLAGEDTSPSSGAEEEDYESENGDENPWLGCVCGQTHPHPIKVFWIQCEGCDAWYNVAEECVGFNEKAAEKLEDWCCWACVPPVAGLGL